MTIVFLIEFATALAAIAIAILLLRWLFKEQRKKHNPLDNQIDALIAERQERLRLFWGESDNAVRRKSDEALRQTRDASRARSDALRQQAARLEAQPVVPAPAQTKIRQFGQR